MMMRALLMAAVAASACTWADVAAAQQVDAAAPGAAPAAPETGGEILVTAQRREQSLQDTPVAVTAITNDMLKQRVVVQVQDIAASTPGLQITPVTASPNAIAISMRGALEVNGGSITSESPVAMYIDDVYQSRLSAANYDLADIVRVEVLRGPQGTLYGRNSMTGAVKLITRQPNGEKWVNTDVSYGTFEEVKAKVSAGAPLGEHIAIAASGFYDVRNKGWQYNEALKTDVGKWHKYGAQVAVGITDVPGLEAVLTGRYGASLTDGQYFVPLNLATNESLLGNFYNTNTPRKQYGNARQDSVSLRLGYDFGAVTLRSITAYSHLSDKLSLDFSGGYTLPGTNQVVTGFNRQSIAGQHQFSEELQLLGKAADGRLNWIAGMFYYDEDAHQSFIKDDFAAFGLTFRPSSYSTVSKSLAFYGQADYKLVNALTVSVGLRYSDDKKSFESLTPNAAGPNALLVPGSNAFKAHVWTPRFNIQYDINPDTMIYATISKGYRAGGFNSLVVANPSIFGSSYRPETAWSYEAGLKAQAFDRKAQLNVAAYYETLSDLQTLADAGGGSFIFQNAAKARVWGVESELTLKPVRNLSLFGSLTYTHDKYAELDPSTQAAQSGAYRLPLLSRWQYQVGGNYTVPIGDDELVLAGDFSYRSKFFTTVSLSPYSLMGPIGRANASVTYKIDGGRVELYVQSKNVLNSKDYFTGFDFIPGVFGYKLPMEPRTVMGGFRFKY